MAVKLNGAFLCAHPAHFVALGFGSGLVPKAPGTFGSLAGWALFPLVAWPFSEPWFFVFLAACVLLGAWVCGKAARAMGREDPGAIVWDEIVAVWLTLAFAPPGLAWQAVAVGLFRVFDIAKPPPVREVDRSVHGGWGIMLDDLVAALYAILALAVLVKLQEVWLW